MTEANGPLAPQSPSSKTKVFIVQIARTGGWGLATAIVILSLVPAGLRPETGLPHDLEHFGIFWAIGGAFAVGYDGHRGRLSTMLVAFAAAVELAQLFAPSRHARLSDFIVDAIAVCAGAISMWLIEWMTGRRRPSAPRSELRTGGRPADRAI